VPPAHPRVARHGRRPHGGLSQGLAAPTSEHQEAPESGASFLTGRSAG
jgi:hypothetical protein